MDFSDIARLNGGFIESRILQAALKLGVFEALGSGTGSASQVADAIAADPQATELLLNALVALSLLEKSGDRFALTQGARTYLLKESPRYFGGMTLFDASLWDLWGRLEQAVQRGEPVRTPDMFQSSEEETERFITAMDSLVKARGDAEILRGVFDFSPARNLLDIGGGPGSYAISLCSAFPGLHVTIFDLLGTLRVTQRLLESTGLSGDRITLVAGDYTKDELPGGFDIAFLSNIIHGEKVGANRALMRKVYQALSLNGSVAIKDHILDSTLTRPKAGAVFSLQMLLTTGGRDYSFDEVAGWLDEAGFRQVEEIPFPPPLTSSLVIGRKIGK